jgi:uncharacterized protein YeaO (DUF488 family)
LSKEKVAHTDWLRNLAPNKKLLGDWKEGRISWDEYKIRYHGEMRGQREAIRDLATKARRGTITLLCFEPEDDPCCHRHLLKELIEEAQ